MSTDAEPRVAWRQELATTGAWVRRTRPGRLVGVAVLTLVMALLSGAIMAQGSVGALVVGGLGVAVFGLWFLPTVVWRAVTGKPVLQLGQGGLRYDPVAVPWTEVVGVGFSGRGAARTVVVRLAPVGGAMVQQQGSRPGRLLRRANDLLAGGPSIGIANGYGIGPDLLAAWIEEVRGLALGQRGW